MSIEADQGLYDYSTRPLRTPTPQGDPGLTLSDDTRLRLYTRLQELRQLEKRAYDLFMQNLVKGTSHLSLGMEAVAAGFGQAMRADDYVFATYRGHAHALSKGASMDGVLAELLGRQNGLMGGKGGSMHLSDAARGMMGSYAIIGAHLTLANGTAWSAQLRDSGQVTVCFFGDGTTNIGAFHEALNFAAVWDLPVVFVCENNLYMEYTPIDFVSPVDHPAADRASAYGLERIVIDGNDVDRVYDTAVRVLERARSGGGPSLVEALTYRSGGHSRADPGKYRPADEVKAWADYDPIIVYHQRLLARGFGEEKLTEINNKVADQVDRATEAAKAGAEPELESIFTELWADGGSTWRN
jgi:pyruvate dehydrogenase E1 component alpha subunit